MHHVSAVKRCARCDRTRPLHEFPSLPSGRHRSTCKECTTVWIPGGRQEPARAPTAEEVAEAAAKAAVARERAAVRGREDAVRTLWTLRAMAELARSLPGVIEVNGVVTRASEVEASLPSLTAAETRAQVAAVAKDLALAVVRAAEDGCSVTDVGDGRRVCTLCRRNKDVTEFYVTKRRRGRLGRETQCRDCVRERMCA